MRNFQTNPKSAQLALPPARTPVGAHRAVGFDPSIPYGTGDAVPDGGEILPDKRCEHWRN